MAVDLTAARATAESVFDASCTIRSDPEQRTDDTFDQATGKLTRPAGDSTTVYSGACLVRPSVGLGQIRAPMGGAEQFVDRYDLRLPVTAVGLAPGQVVTIDTAPNDPDIVGNDYTILQVAGGSMAVTRIVTVQLRTPGPHV